MPTYGRLYSFTSNARLIETLPILQPDPNRPEDLLKMDADEEGVGGDGAGESMTRWIGCDDLSGEVAAG